ncbi:uncharacterized protein LOC111616129 [Centruroides sculpturatus]|uniref:uncharacterized protein LOC111616129 n=1 Tax=Centruroides sculpturatus TaxID=218467 RepID=UPI000C6EB055|nr:uncharacterized protein LOC111616129 [Centruroides sculpturatus]
MVYLIEDFIIPSLQSGRFGKLLKWDDEKNRIFKVSVCHKRSGEWSEEDCRVFVEWDRLNKREDKTEKNFYTNSRGRFINALNRLKEKVKQMPSPLKKKYRLYQLINYEMTETEELAELQRSVNQQSSLQTGEEISIVPTGEYEQLPEPDERSLFHELNEWSDHSVNSVSSSESSSVLSENEDLLNSPSSNDTQYGLSPLPSDSEMYLDLMQFIEEQLNFSTDTSSGSEQDLDNLRTDLLTDDNILLHDPLLSENNPGNIGSFYENGITSDNRPENQSGENEVNIFLEFDSPDLSTLQLFEELTRDARE